MKPWCRLLSAVLLAGVAALGAQVSSAQEAQMVRVEPKQSDELIANPGMGWQTFHRFADEDPNLAGLPSGAAYFRFYWRDVEPREGEIQFARLDELLAHARRAGQKLGFRIMVATTETAADSGAPDWLREKGCPGFEYEYGREGRKYWVPDLNHPLFKEAHYRFLRALGQRYDGHPDVDYVDIGTVGLWGEWHMSGTGVDMPSLETRMEIIDVYFEAFPKTPKLMLIGDIEPLRYATSKGAGWRADCLGDMGGFSKTWSHMADVYRQHVAAAQCENAWQQAPVAWESCWDMRKWATEGWDIRYIFDYALDLHGSYVNNKSAPIPEGTRAEVERLLRRLGYRLVLRSLTHADRASAGGRLRIEMEWENAGVAPAYRDYRLAYRLTDATDRERVVVSDLSIRGWLPGKRKVSDSVALPEGLAKGRCELALGVVDPATRAPAVRLAIQGRDQDGWYPLSAFDVN